MQQIASASARSAAGVSVAEARVNYAAHPIVETLTQSALVKVLNPTTPKRYLLVLKIDDDSLSERIATFYDDVDALLELIADAPDGWWPDCRIDLESPLEVAVRDAAAGDGSLGDPYPFDEEHVVWA